ncbi:MAG: hypothetical protein WC184_02425 [Acidimicrobiia bacterium]
MPDSNPTELIQDENCELCEAARYTHWYFEDELCWVADCEVCSVPMVVWKGHGPDPDEASVAIMIERLVIVATERFGANRFEIDRNMRQIPTHFHAHARDENWWAERMNRPFSLYTGVGTKRITR